MFPAHDGHFYFTLLIVANGTVRFWCYSKTRSSGLCLIRNPVRKQLTSKCKFWCPIFLVNWTGTCDRSIWNIRLLCPNNRIFRILIVLKLQEMSICICKPFKSVSFHFIRKSILLHSGENFVWKNWNHIPCSHRGRIRVDEDDFVNLDQEMLIISLSNLVNRFDWFLIGVSSFHLVHPYTPTLHEQDYFPSQTLNFLCS